MTTTCAQALKQWEANNEGKPASEATEISLCFQSIAKLDSKALGTLKKCEKLSLSTNMIDKMVNLPGMTELKILSLGRNNLKKIEKLEDVAGTLEQLWLSYNQIASLDGLSCLTNLTTLYCSNNLIKSVSELDKLKANEKLRDVVFIGNPFYGDVASKEEARIEILRHLPNLVKIDGEFVKPSELEIAQAPPPSE
jgi:dynein light chain 1